MDSIRVSLVFYLRVIVVRIVGIGIVIIMVIVSLSYTDRSTNIQVIVLNMLSINMVIVISTRWYLLFFFFITVYISLWSVVYIIMDIIGILNGNTMIYLSWPNLLNVVIYCRLFVYVYTNVIIDTIILYNKMVVKITVPRFIFLLLDISILIFNHELRIVWWVFPIKKILY